MILCQQISQSQISQQQKYNSFILVKTLNKQIAQKWPFYILSLNNQLLMNTQQADGTQKKGTKNNGAQKSTYKSKNKSEDLEYEYNISIQSFCCMIGSQKFVIADAEWALMLIREENKKHQHWNQPASLFSNLSFAKELQFYYYVNQLNIIKVNKRSQIEPENPTCQGIFARIYPKYLVGTHCMIFSTTPVLIQENSQEQKEICYFQNFASSINFKNISNLIKLNSRILKQIKENIREHSPQSAGTNIFALLSLNEATQNKCKQENSLLQLFDCFHFSSDYALLSDQHFLNCFVRGKKKMASYVKIQTLYWFFMDEVVYETLKKLHTQPRL